MRNDSIVFAGVISATLAIIFLVPLVGLVWWMAWRFLLGQDESNEEFEPTCMKSLAVSGRRRQQAPLPAVELYTDNVSDSSTPEGVVPKGYLSQAYEEQMGLAQEPSFQTPARPVEISSMEELHDEAMGELEQPSNEVDTPASTTDASTPLRCQTTARFEYMSQSYTGPHSWVSYPLVPLILSACATIFLLGLPVLIHEDRQYKLRAPSP